MALIMPMASENTGWDYRQIQGGLLKQLDIHRRQQQSNALNGVLTCYLTCADDIFGEHRVTLPGHNTRQHWVPLQRSSARVASDTTRAEL